MQDCTTQYVVLEMFRRTGQEAMASGWERQSRTEGTEKAGVCVRPRREWRV